MRLLSLLFAVIVLLWMPAAASAAGTTGDTGPVVENPGFEWSQGYHAQDGVQGLVPNGWTAMVLNGNPMVSSTDHWAKEGCGPDAFVERLEQEDSAVFLAVPTRCGQGFVAPPFDLALYQRVAVESGEEYSLSAWMVSLCGGSGNPNPCPAGAYIAKLTGLDPTGGVDPTSASVHWVEDRRPHIEARWVNLIDATTAQTSTLTLFIRINSPFQFEGNHAFADAVKLVRAPRSAFAGAVSTGDHIAVNWTGDLGPDIPAIPAGNYRLAFEVQVRQGAGDWQPWLWGPAGYAAEYPPPVSCLEQTYHFRIRAWAAQPAGERGAFPNHLFVGPWHVSELVRAGRLLTCLPQAYAPLIAR